MVPFCSEDHTKVFSKGDQGFRISRYILSEPTWPFIILLMTSRYCLVSDEAEVKKLIKLVQDWFAGDPFNRRDLVTNVCQSVGFCMLVPVYPRTFLAVCYRFLLIVSASFRLHQMEVVRRSLQVFSGIRWSRFNSFPNRNQYCKKMRLVA